MNIEDVYYEDKQDTLESEEAMNVFMKMLRLKYSVHYYHDVIDKRLVVVIQTILEPKIKIRDEFGCKHVYFDKYNYLTCDTRYELDDELFFNFTPKELADLIEKDFESVLAKEGE